MSDATTTTATTQAQTADVGTALAAIPWWAAATPEQRTAVIGDCLRSGIPAEEYAEAAADWPDAASLLAETAPQTPDQHADAVIARLREQADATGDAADIEDLLQAEHAAGRSPAPATAADGATPAAAQAEGAAAQARQSQADAEAAEQAARAEASATLKQCVSAYRKGERAYRDGLLGSGKYAGLYIRQRLTLGDKRDAAVQAIAGKLAEYASAAVDVNALVGCYNAWRLLAGGPDGEEPTPEQAKWAADVPYGHYKEAWRQLVLRVDEGKPTEHWTLLPGSEAQCRAAFAAAVKGGLSRAACVEKAKAVVAEHVRIRAEATEAEAAAKRRTAVAAAAEKAAAAAQTEAAKRAEEQAKRAAEQAAKDEDRARLTEAANKAAEERRAAERVQAAALDEAIAAQREQAKAEATAAEAKRIADKAAEKAQAAAAKANKPPQAAKQVPPATAAPAGATPDLPQKPQPHVAPVSKQVAAATAKDAAEVLAEAIAGHETPDDVLQALLTALRGKYAKAMSKPALRAIHAALVLLERADSPSPVEVAKATLEQAGVDKADAAKAVAAA